MGVTFDSITLSSDPLTGRVRWSRDAFRALERAGFFTDGRYELLDGEILRILPNEPQMFVTTSLVFALAEIFGKEFIRIGSLAADEHNEPQPDVAVAKKPIRGYLSSGIPAGPEFPPDRRLALTGFLPPTG